MKTYGGVPKIDIPLKYLLGGTFTHLVPANRRSSIFIIEDLDKAIPLLPKQSGLTAEELGRTTQGAALALKARAALFEGTWQKYHGMADAGKYLDLAIQAAQAIVDSKEYELYREKGELSYKYLHILERRRQQGSLVGKRYYKIESDS